MIGEGAIIYNIKQVTEQLGIPAVTLRAWEKRYGLSPSNRTEGGHRIYSEQDIKELKWVKSLMDEKNISISRAVKLLESKKEAPMFENGYNSHNFQAIIEQLYDSLSEFNYEKSNSIVEFSFSLFHFEKVLHFVFLPLLKKTIEQWYSGKISIAQEHFINNYILQRCYLLFHSLPTNSDICKVIALCPENEKYEIGLLIFSLFLKQRGINVIYLGRETPITSIKKTIYLQDITHICISLSSSMDLDMVGREIQGLKNNFPNLKFILGGSGFNSKEQSSLQEWIISQNPTDWEDWFYKNFF
ncbi:MerR family transcriptional regulator [Bacillus wiedmannii]|uniref:MerR family transcriptional regulator n=1 Tax=Bacillus wiedmannii TaxID=1890302 RepID=UPI000B432A8E|nr:MerR family transcriptional regulator [Bacillus wiedmannii]OUB80908.1 hypothetical protein BK788_25050 [Bacillus thuringiensis serovar sinensis]